MSTNRKLVIVLSILAAAVFAVITGLVIVLVANEQHLTSAVKMSYTAENVHIKLYATLYDGDNSYVFKDGDMDYLELSATVTTGMLSQPDTSVQIELTGTRAIFEYRFENMSSIDAEIRLLSIPTTNANFTLQYCVSESQTTNFNTGLSELIYDTTDGNDQYYIKQSLNGESSCYIYIVADATVILQDGEINGSFTWDLKRVSE